MKSLSIALALICLTSATQADWPSFRGPNHNAILDSIAFQAIEGEPERLWKTEVGGGHSSCVVAKGKLYTIGAAQLVCLNAETGEEIWKQPVANTYGAPTVFDGRVYTLGGVQPIAACHSALTGEEIWTQQLPATKCGNDYFHCAPPLVWNDLIILNAGAGVALQTETGEQVWTHPGIAGMSAPVICQLGQIPAVAVFGGESCVFRDPKTGAELASIPWSANEPVTAADPLVFDGKVLLSGSYGPGRTLFELEQVRQVWSVPGVEQGHIWASPILWRGGLYGFTKTAFVSLDLNTGQPKWTREGLAGSLTILGDSALVLTERGELHIGPLDADNAFEPTLIAQLSGGKTWSLPAFSDGKLFIRNDAGEVSCWRIAEENR